LITRGQAVEGIENPVAFGQAVFALQEGEISQPISTGNHYLIAKLLERNAAYLPPFEEVQAAVQEALVQERSMALARQHADAWLNEVNAGKSLDELAQLHNTQVEQTGLFSRNSTIPTLGRPQAFIKEAFQMRLGDARVADLMGQPAIIVLKERQAFDAEAYEKEKAQLKQRIARQRRDQVFAQWSNDLRQQAEERRRISINQSALALL
jgi:hypothetical protein